MSVPSLMGIYVDDELYNVYVKYDTFKRDFEIMEGSNTGKSMSARSIRDILGTGYSFNFTVTQNPEAVSDYDRFYDVITEPVDSHWFVLPFGQNKIAFEGQVTSGSDSYLGDYAGRELWDELTLTIKPMEPQRKVV